MHRDHQPDASPDWGTPHRWSWQGLHCHWQCLGDPAHPALVLLHGFGAALGVASARYAGALRFGGAAIAGFGALLLLSV